MQLRVTLINAGNLAAQAFGGLIAAGILGDMEGVHGTRAWRWLFIVEGAATVGWAVVAAFLLLDFPANTKRLTDRERAIAVVWPIVCAVVVGSTFVHGLSVLVISLVGSLRRRKAERSDILGGEAEGLQGMVFGSDEDEEYGSEDEAEREEEEGERTSV